MNPKNKYNGNRSWADVVKQQPQNIMKGKNENTNDKTITEKENETNSLILLNESRLVN